MLSVFWLLLVVFGWRLSLFNMLWMILVEMLLFLVMRIWKLFGRFGVCVFLVGCR